MTKESWDWLVDKTPEEIADIRAKQAESTQQYHKKRRAEKLAQTMERRCLKCGKKFSSWGPGNRLCDYCRGQVNAGSFSNVAAGWDEK